MDEGEAGNRPEYSGSFLFLVELALGFKKCSSARAANNIQLLFRSLESMALALSGYYDRASHEKNDKIELEIQNKIDVIRRDLAGVAKNYEATDNLEIPESLYLKLYLLEKKLRTTWKDSGLQMSLKSEDDLNEY
jgi:hypothetical protein